MSRPTSLTAVSSTALLGSSVPCRVRSLHIYNPGNAVAYTQFFNAAAVADVTVGTTVPDLVFGAATLKAVSANLGDGVVFGKGLVVAAATTATGNSAPNGAQVVAMVID